MSFIRKASLILIASQDIAPPGDVPLDNAIDLSDFRFTFKVGQEDIETPNNARIRVFNLSDSTVKKIRGEFSRVVLQAGYEEQFGIIFDGTIKQFGIGRMNATDTYLDILAADGDTAYNFATINTSLEASATAPANQIKLAVNAMAPQGVDLGFFDTNGLIGGTNPNPRGKVMFGMVRHQMRNLTNSVGATWSIQNGKVNVIPLTGYLPGEVIKMNSLTGMVGIPEQQVDGIHLRSLLNPRIVPGQLIEIDNASVNKILAQNPNAGPLQNFPFDQRAALPSLLASVTNDGIYRVFVCEHEGDTRGQPWYSDLTCLAVDPVSLKVQAYG